MDWTSAATNHAVNCVLHSEFRGTSGGHVWPQRQFEGWSATKMAWEFLLAHP